MRRLKIIIFSILLCIPITVNAANSLSITCSSTEVRPGDIVTCNIKGFAEEDIGAVEADIVYGNSMTRNSFVASSGWSGDDTNNRIDMFETSSDDLSGNFDLATFSIKISENAPAGEIKFELKNIVFYKDNTSYNVDSISFTFNVLGNNQNNSTAPTLESLEVTGGTLSPAVITEESDVYAIILDPGVDTFSIVATPSNASYTVTAKNTDTNESIALSSIKFKTASGKKEMSITIIVTADSNNSKSYTILVSKGNANIGEPELKTLTIGDVDVKLESGKYDYIVKLEDVSIYMIEATLKDSENYKFSDFLTPPKYLQGEREFVLEIIPRDPSSKLSSATYTISVKGPGATEIPLSPSSQQQAPSSQNPGGNPQTGNTSAYFMAIIIVLSLIASFYLYKMNMNKYNSN